MKEGRRPAVFVPPAATDALLSPQMVHKTRLSMQADSAPIANGAKDPLEYASR